MFIRLSLLCFMSIFPFHTYGTAVTPGNRLLLYPFYRWGKSGVVGLSYTLYEAREEAQAPTLCKPLLQDAMCCLQGTLPHILGRNWNTREIRAKEITSMQGRRLPCSTWREPGSLGGAQRTEPAPCRAPGWRRGDSFMALALLWLWSLTLILMKLHRSPGATQSLTSPEQRANGRCECSQKERSSPTLLRCTFFFCNSAFY